MNYQEIKQKHQEDYDKIMKENLVFWAFSNEQFLEGLKKINHIKGEKITSIGAGGYMPSKNTDKMFKQLDILTKAQKQEIKKAKEEKENAILYELRNFECFYTGNTEEVVNIFKGIYTKQDIKKVFSKHLQTVEA